MGTWPIASIPICELPLDRKRFIDHELNLKNSPLQQVLRMNVLIRPVSLVEINHRKFSVKVEACDT